MLSNDFCEMLQNTFLQNASRDLILFLPRKALKNFLKHTGKYLHWSHSFSKNRTFLTITRIRADLITSHKVERLS